MLRFIRSVCYALRGISYAVRTQMNMKIHIVAAVLVVAVSLYLKVPPLEQALLVITVFMVWAAELFNTALEKLVDLVSPEKQVLAGIVKDVAAGAVLVTAINAVLMAYLIIWPRLYASGWWG